MSDKFKRITRVSPAFDSRHDDPKKNYGIGSMTLRFVLVGELGAVQFVFYTAQYTRNVADELFNKNRKYNPFHGMGADIGYHSPIAMYDGQHQRDCDVIPCGKCFYDGSSLRASEFADEFISGGDAVVWPMLEREYAERFEADK